MIFLVLVIDTSNFQAPSDIENHRNKHIVTDTLLNFTIYYNQAALSLKLITKIANNRTILKEKKNVAKRS